MTSSASVTKLPVGFVRRSKNQQRHPLLATTLALALAACNGSTQGRNGANGGGPSGPGGAGSSGTGPGPNTIGPDGNVSCDGVDPGPAPLRRLTRFEYNNTVRDLLGDTSRPADALPPEELGNGFGNDADSLGVSPLLAQKYHGVAGEIAARALATETSVEALSGCKVASKSELECAKALVTTFGARAYRGPVEAVEVDNLTALFSTLRASETYLSAMQGVLQSMLQSARFLYRVEFGVPAAPEARITKATPFEMASRLSYMLWGSMPDEQLLTAARENRLSTTEEVKAQAQRMLQDAKARQVVRLFFDTLLKLSGSDTLKKNATEHPTFVGMAPLLQEETERFLEEVIWNGPGDLGTLLSADYSFMNARVAQYYGVSGPTGDAFERVQLDPTQRAGLLTQALPLSILTPGTHTNPTVRGVFMLQRLLCSSPPDPPKNLNPMEPKYDASLTTRERFAIHAQDPTCAACHTLMDPFGFALENYDAVGLWRSTENGKPIDASATITGAGDMDGPVNGPMALVHKLAVSEQVRACMVGHWFSFGYGRNRTEQDICTEKRLGQAFASGGYRIQDLILALTQTDAFLYRPVNAP